MVSSSSYLLRSIGLANNGSTYGSNVFQYGFSRWYFCDCTPQHPVSGSTFRANRSGTHALPFITLDNGEGPRVTDLLHHLPLDRLFVFAVNLSRFDELVFHFLDGSRINLCVEVCYDGVNHFLWALLLNAYDNNKS